MVLVIPPLLPLPILSVLLTLFFNDYQCSTVTLYPSPVLNTVAAGLRSALIVDIGWSETIITAVSEFREVLGLRTTRAMKRLTKETGRFLAQRLRKAHEWHEAEEEEDEDEVDERYADEISFEETEDCMNRVVWCCTREESTSLKARNLLGSLRRKYNARKPTQSVILNDHESKSSHTKVRGAETEFLIPLKSAIPQITLKISFDRLAIPTEEALFPELDHPDDQELPIHQIVYDTLRSLPLDVRAECASRIVFTGGGARIPGLKQRVLEELSHLIASNGWQGVKGRAFDQMKNHLRERSQNRIARPIQERKSEIDEHIYSHPDHSREPADLPQERDPVVERIEKERVRVAKPSVKAIVRGVETFGPWTGGSIVSGTKVLGTVVIEKEKFLLHGIPGATREMEPSVTQRVGSTQTGTRTHSQDKSSWALGSYWM
jgi:actin-related protein